MERYKCKASQRARILRALFLVGSASLAAAGSAHAQTHEHDGPASRRGHVHGQAVFLGTHVSPGLYGVDRTEGYVTQPMVMLRVQPGIGLTLQATGVLEGWTMERGELTPGSWGEGYVDRRHPHTYLHEALASWQIDVGAADISVSAGKGFAPFGTDDPMSRPFVKFPANHHLAQILERAVVIGAARFGFLGLEGARFNGEEPADPADFPNLSRFGDSWAARATVYPFAGVEVQLSRAWVESAEQPRGDGLDQRKWSASARVERDIRAGRVYALAEWARTEELQNDRFAFDLPSVLVEAALERDGWRGAMRLERTERTEEERLADPYRTPWPHADIRPIGRTRWTTVSAGLRRSVDIGALRLQPLAEGSVSRVTDVVPGAIFVARDHFGSDRILSASVGLRVAYGGMTRMGRYGAARSVDHTAH